MTRYILIGGCQDKADLSRLGRAFYEHAPVAPNFLICLFARNSEIYDLNQVFQEQVQFFQSLDPDRQVRFVMATEDEFIQQIQAADIIFFVGGDQLPLYATLARIGNGWIEHLHDKIIAGSSAGADLLTTYNFDQQQGACARGLGLVPVKSIVHFGSDDATIVPWPEAKLRLTRYGRDLPIVLLPEGEFRVFDI